MKYFVLNPYLPTVTDIDTGFVPNSCKADKTRW